jgi:uncharacterized protein YggE
MPFFDAPVAELRTYRSAVVAPDDLDAYWQEAIADARRKAEIYARAAGAKVGQVVAISENGIGQAPIPMQALRASAVPVAPGEQTLRAQVTVSYELTP